MKKRNKRLYTQAYLCNTCIIFSYQLLFKNSVQWNWYLFNG